MKYAAEEDRQPTVQLDSWTIADRLATLYLLTFEEAAILVTMTGTEEAARAAAEGIRHGLTFIAVKLVLLQSGARTASDIQRALRQRYPAIGWRFQ